MCGRSANPRSAPALQAATRAEKFVDADKYSPSNNVGPTRYQPVLRKNGDDRELRSMKWGLIPRWTKSEPDFKAALNTINARDDSVNSGRSMWNAHRNKMRCAVVVEGFFEWKKEGKDRQPFFMRSLKEGELLIFGGFFDIWTKTEGEPVYSYTIITTASNSQLSWLHDRMPMILSNENDIDRWLDSSLDYESVRDLVQPFKGLLECYPVSTFVNKIGNDSSECLLRMQPSSEVTKAKTKPISSFFSTKSSATKSRETKTFKTEDGDSAELSSQQQEQQHSDDDDVDQKTAESNKRALELKVDVDSALPSEPQPDSKRAKTDQDEKIAQLAQLGFSTTLILQALESTQNIDEATNWLIDHADMSE